MSRNSLVSSRQITRSSQGLHHGIEVMTAHFVPFRGDAEKPSRCEVSPGKTSPIDPWTSSQFHPEYLHEMGKRGNIVLHTTQFFNRSQTRLIVVDTCIRGDRGLTRPARELNLVRPSLPKSGAKKPPRRRLPLHEHHFRCPT